MDNERIKTIYRELELLRLPKWRYKQIMAFCHCASAKANEIRKKALDCGGKIDYDPHAVQSRAVLALMGTTPEVEIKKRCIELNAGADPEPTESDQ